jgi:hypothetical protein
MNDDLKAAAERYRRRFCNLTEVQNMLKISHQELGDLQEKEKFPMPDEHGRYERAAVIAWLNAQAAHGPSAAKRPR